MNLRRTLGGLAALAVATSGVLLMSGPAQAQTAPKNVCGTWKARGATGAYPQITFGGKPAGTEILNNSVKLVKPTEGTNPGVEFAAFDLDVETTESTTVTVKYSLAEGASSSAGAIRVFAYYVNNADTLNDAPSHFDVATNESGTLSFVVPAEKTIGTLGLVYDASNDSTGSVRFTDLKIGKRSVNFVRCTSDPIKKPVAKPSASTPIKKPMATPSKSSATTTPANTGGGDNNASGPTLPVTGPGLPVSLLALGVFVIGLGVVATHAARRKTRRFTA